MFNRKSRTEKRAYNNYILACKKYNNFLVANGRYGHPQTLANLEREMKEAEKEWNRIRK